MFAERIVDLDQLDYSRRSESFAEMLGETLVENLPNNVELTDDEWRKLQTYLQDFGEEELELKKLPKQKGVQCMDSFADVYGKLTVADAIYLNKVAKALESING